MQKLNWLYPNFLRRIDHYLKINYPHVWRTRVHDFGWFSLVLGNVMAAVLGVLIVGRNNVLSAENVMTLHSGLAVLMAFVVLFWAIRLLRFKMRFSNFETMLTTWMIYVLCVVSLGLNLVTFTSSIAYRTACIYPDEVIQADYDYITDTENRLISNGYYAGNKHKDPYESRVLKLEYMTDDLLNIMQRHDRSNTNKAILMLHVRTVADRINRFKEAKVFIQQPILGRDFYNSGKTTSYHELLRGHWVMGILILYFLPALLFLVSVFGGRNVLISAFCTVLIGGLVFIGLETFFGNRGLKWEPVLMTYIFIVFGLMLTLIIGKNRLQNWNYIAGIFMLMLGIVFFMALIVDTSLIGHQDKFLRVAINILPCSLIVSLLSAWIITKRNNEPVLR